MFYKVDEQKSDLHIINGVLSITNEILREKAEKLATLNCDKLRTGMKMTTIEKIKGGIKNKSQ
ncbi:hypothetical protein AGMMS49532_08760 [Endomicrobiia bacterium]|uniref:hypothetical protein n=1 Tax=Endomicrobium trichonymphae TaxID=1408204 RepID=UPI000BBAF252|nr:hypothetical protein [Candidatus Endomicrobium trichonymphae]GHT09829.1 hypothetical protein AGMMS49532_08760 [Endomicrobiia bacterium]GHT24978.1 hypothetical protein AGMMS49953_08730 [Endomicrobiia bacterium]